MRNFALTLVVIVVVVVAATNALLTNNNVGEQERTFTIDRTPGVNSFRKDGQLYRYISGTMHYFQVPYGYWQDRMLKMRAAGLNALQTYIAWNMHEPFKGVYDFDEQNNIFEYFQMAQNNSLDFILRIGPFINGERDNGGLPFWLLNVNPQMRPRTSDPSYQAEVKLWWDFLLPKIVPHLYINGGNILTVQIENEYGCYSTCDKAYLKWLYDLAVSHLGSDVVYFTTDTATSQDWMRCGQIDGAQVTSDFRVGENATLMLDNLRAVEPSGPLVNSEFYPGWIVHWNENYTAIADDLYLAKMEQILQYENSTSVNIYPVHGGTNFGFSAGATHQSGPSEYYHAFITSYDFNAPINENGDTTTKFLAIRELTPKYLPNNGGPLPDIPPNITRKAYGTIALEKCGDIFSEGDLNKFTTLATFATDGEPQTYESILLDYGFALYEHTITADDLAGRQQANDAATLLAPGIHDRAVLFIDHKRIDFLCRTCEKFNITIDTGSANSPLQVGSKLSLLVENQGRAAFGADTDQKGLNIDGSPLLLAFGSNFHSVKLVSWTITPIPANGTLWAMPTGTVSVNSDVTPQTFLPTRYQGTFLADADPVLGHPADTFLRLNADDDYANGNMERFWRKGVVLVNGRNLGRYWLAHSSQQTLYVPGVWLRSAPQLNYLTILETDYSPCECVKNTPDVCKCQVQLVDTPFLDHKLPVTDE